MICKSSFAKISESFKYSKENVIDVSFITNIDEDLLITEAVNYLLLFNQFVKKQNCKEMGDMIEKDTYEIVRDYKRKI